MCPLCNAAMEDVQHVFFRCDVARVVLRKICRWWDLDWQEICSFSDWDAWFLSFRLSSRLKSIEKVVFYVALGGMADLDGLRISGEGRGAGSFGNTAGFEKGKVLISNPYQYQHYAGMMTYGTQVEIVEVVEGVTGRHNVHVATLATGTHR
ncbi:hypothetical protein Tco_0413581 [Tanacetum coccineum]